MAVTFDASRPARHGTEWRYSVGRCRCQECRTAHAYAARVYRRARAARTGERILHGRWVPAGRDDQAGTENRR